MALALVVVAVWACSSALLHNNTGNVDMNNIV
jgi:hypothetical protein